MRRKIIAAILCAAALCISVFASGCSCGGESAGEGHKIAGAEEQVTAAVGIMNNICSAGERRGGLFSGDGREVVPSAEPKDASGGGIADVADILDKHDLPHDVDLEARVAELYRRYILHASDADMSVTTLNFYENREYGGITFRYYRFDLGARMIITARYSVADDMSLSRAGFDITTGRGAIFDTDMSEDDSEEIFGYIDSGIGRIRSAVGSYEEANEAAAGENGISPPPDGASVKVSFDFSLLKRLLGL